jgi:protein-S-isoprenylcysteine O-methyltransferase Ste14
VNAKFLEHGGLWVVGQSVLMVSGIALALVYQSQRAHPISTAVGYILIAVGGYFGVSGVAALKGNRTAFPRPREQSQLIQSGIYAHVRHPLYTSVVLVSAGWALSWGSAVAFGVALAMIPFFQAKAKVEERWLRQKFPEYSEYERRVPRFIPWLY